MQINKETGEQEYLTKWKEYDFSKDSWDRPAAAELGANKAAWRAASASSRLTRSNSSKSVIPRATTHLIFLYHNFFCL
ncbi:hypothetical protein MKX08_000979 [Trichoderma sp. CBMAI-0020]|nr:hypothetical protein MKX08_000979 [Trichoderma sp. CBMAI-0020]